MSFELPSFEDEPTTTVDGYQLKDPSLLHADGHLLQDLALDAIAAVALRWGNGRISDEVEIVHGYIQRKYGQTEDEVG